MSKNWITRIPTSSTEPDVSVMRNGSGVRLNLIGGGFEGCVRLDADGARELSEALLNAAGTKSTTTMGAIDAMEHIGGSFVRALAEAVVRADEDNRARLVRAFPEVFQRYEQIAASQTEAA